MNAIVIYKSKYGATKAYASWIAEEIGCEALESKSVSADDLSEYDVVVYGGGLYAEVISGVNLITKNFEKLKDKKLVVYTTGITPASCRDYYDKLVIEKNFKPPMLNKIKVYNFPGKMIISELSLVHKGAIKTLKKLMSSKQNPTEMEELLVKLCDADGDFTDKSAIKELVEYIKQ